MRKSKVARQEARRGRRKMLRRAEKPDRVEARYTVVREDDVRIPKYLFSEAAEGFDRAHAEELAYHVTGQRTRYAVVPLEVHRWARAKGEPLSPQAALAAFRGENPDA
jgi:hypothetical protein